MSRRKQYRIVVLMVFRATGSDDRFDSIRFDSIRFDSIRFVVMCPVHGIA